MKHVIFKTVVALLLVCNASMDAQEISKKSELKLNIPLSLTGFVEVSYERILSSESAMGVSVGFAFEDIYFDFAAIPYYRFYFGKKEAAGFFLEGNAALYAQEYDQFSLLTNQERTNSKLGFGLGVAIGFKLITAKGWIGEIYAGAGRNFLNTDFIDSGYPRIGLNMGKRF